MNGQSWKEIMRAGSEIDSGERTEFKVELLSNDLNTNRFHSINEERKILSKSYHGSSPLEVIANNHTSQLATVTFCGYKKAFPKE